MRDFRAETRCTERERAAQDVDDFSAYFLGTFRELCRTLYKICTATTCLRKCDKKPWPDDAMPEPLYYQFTSLTVARSLPLSPSLYLASQYTASNKAGRSMPLSHLASSQPFKVVQPVEANQEVGDSGDVDGLPIQSVDWPR